MKTVLVFLMATILLSCQGTKKIDTGKETKTVRLFVVPLNKTYTIAVDYKRIKSYSDVKVKPLASAQIYNDLVSFVGHIDTLKTSSYYSSVDARVLIEFKTPTGDLSQIGVNADGSLMIYKDKVYEQASHIVSSIEHNSDMKWE